MLGEDSQWLSHEKNTNKISSNRSSNTSGHQTWEWKIHHLLRCRFSHLKKTKKQVPPKVSSPLQSRSIQPQVPMNNCRLQESFSTCRPIPLVNARTWCRLERPLNRLDTEVVPLRYKCDNTTKVSLHASQMTSTARCNPSHHFNRYRGFPETSPCHWGMPRFKFGRFPHPITSALTGKLI